MFRVLEALHAAVIHLLPLELRHHVENGCLELRGKIAEVLAVGRFFGVGVERDGNIVFDLIERRRGCQSRCSSFSYLSPTRVTM